MKKRLLDFLVCAVCKGGLGLRVGSTRGDEVIDGVLTCEECGTSFPILRGVPRFVSATTYAESFAFEWRRFSTVQLDSVRQSSESARGFKARLPRAT